MYTLDDDIMRQLRATFQVEAVEHIQAMNRVLLAIESDSSPDEGAALLEEIFREAHSLKGAAGAADAPEIEVVAHRLESVLGAARADRIALTHEVCDVLYQGIDAVSAILKAALAGQPHGVDLADLFAQLEAIANGQCAPFGPIRTATTAHAAQAPGSRPDALAELAIDAALAQPDVMSKTLGGEDRKATSASLGPAIEETIRVATSKIDSLMTQAGELLVAGLKVDLHLKEVEQISRALEVWQREWLQVRAAHSHVLRESGHGELRPIIRFLELNQAALRKITAQITDLRRGFSHDALNLSRVTHDLSESVLKARMLPVAAAFDAFPRLVRDLARNHGKEIELKLEGADTELDRKVLEEIKDPLIHLLRNAVDHGIEPPEVREQRGKPRQGAITVRAFQKGNHIVIAVADDGAGVDRDRVKRAAMKAGLIGADEAAGLNDDAALRLIFATGLSTSPVITNTSGRGVGMDVVRKNVEALHGQVDITSMLGRGTTITVTLPLTLATTQHVLVQVSDQTYGIPISAVERIERISLKDIGRVAGRETIVVADEPILLVRLAEVLERPDARPTDRVGETRRAPVVILSSFNKRVAFLVDSVLGRQETVVKSLGKQLARVRNVAGATILGSGQVLMILNPSDLMKSARVMRGRRNAAPATHAGKGQRPGQATILVVDDSLSTRTLQKNILEAAGYKVEVATDGLEAMSLLNSNGGCDLIVSDVVMPRMSGLELTAAVRKQSALNNIPVVLVTSLDSREDKERGIEVGADAYLVKDKFDQASLLATIEQLI